MAEVWEVVTLLEVAMGLPDQVADMGEAPAEGRRILIAAQALADTGKALAEWRRTLTGPDRIIPSWGIDRPP